MVRSSCATYVLYIIYHMLNIVQMTNHVLYVIYCVSYIVDRYVDITYHI